MNIKNIIALEDVALDLKIAEEFYENNIEKNTNICFGFIIRLQIFFLFQFVFFTQRPA